MADTTTTPAVTPVAQTPTSTTTPATTVAAPTVDPTIATLISDVSADITLGQSLVAAWRSGGKDAVLAALPGVIPVIEKDYADVKAAIPAIKAGYKTTEFWLTVVLLAGNAVYTGITKKTLPFDLNATLAALVSIYAVVRGLIKGSASTPAPAIATAPAK